MQVLVAAWSVQLLFLALSPASQTAVLEDTFKLLPMNYLPGVGENSSMALFTRHFPHARHAGFSRVKRQMLYFVLSFLGEEGIRNYVKSTKTENIPSLISSVGPDEILYIVASLPADEILRVLTSLQPEDVLKLARTLSPPQLAQLLSYVPTEGLVNLTDKFSPTQLEILVKLLPPDEVVNLTLVLPVSQTRKMLKSMSTEVIYNLTLSLSPNALVKMMASLPSDIVAHLLGTMSPENLENILKAIPLDLMIPFVTTLSPKMVRNLITLLPSGFLDTLLSKISPGKIAQAVQSIPAEQLIKLLAALQAEDTGEVLDLSKFLKPESVSALFVALPKEFIVNLIQKMEPRQIIQFIFSIPPSFLSSIASYITTEQSMQILTAIPPDIFSTLMKSIPADSLANLTNNFPTDVIVNMISALFSDNALAETILNSLTPKFAAQFFNSFSRRTLLEIMQKLPDHVLSNMTSVLSKNISKFYSWPGLFNAIFKFMMDIPPKLLVKMAKTVPPLIIANISNQLTQDQMKTILRQITPDRVKIIVQTFSPETIIQFIQGLPEATVNSILQNMPHKSIRSLIQAVPIDVIRDFILAILPVEGSDFGNKQILAADRVVSILDSVDPDSLTSIVKAIPPKMITNIINALPKPVLAQLAAVLSGEENVPILRFLPVDAFVHIVSIIPPYSIVKVVDAVPQRTIGAFANMAMNVSEQSAHKFFSLLDINNFKSIITKLPPKTIEKLASSLPPETVERMAHSLSPVTMEPIMESFRPRELRRLLRSVNEATLASLLNSIPPEMIVNISKAFSAEQISKLFGAIPPETIGMLMTRLDPKYMVDLMKSMPSSVIENILTTLPQELIINMTRVLPSEQMKDLLDLLPGQMIGKMVSILPQDVIINLVTTLQPSVLLDMMQKLSSDQLMDVLGTLPHYVILNLIKTQTPQQTIQLLSSIPSNGLVNLTKLFPSEIFLEMMQSIPPEAILQLMSNVPIKELFLLAGQFTPEEVVKMVEMLLMDADLIPDLLAAIDMDRMLSVMEALPVKLLLDLMSRVDMSKIKELMGRFLPKVQTVMLGKLEDLFITLSQNSSLSFQNCLQDVYIVLNELFTFNEWALKMLDASGKPSRGLLEGNVHMIGNFDQCKSISHKMTVEFREQYILAGSYCHVQFNIPVQHLPPVPGQGILPMPEIALDVCLPDSCKAVDIYNFLKLVQMPMNVTVPRVSCQEDQELAKDFVAMFAVSFVCLLIIMVIIGTVVDCLYFHYHPVTNIINNNQKYSQTMKRNLHTMAALSDGTANGQERRCNKPLTLEMIEKKKLQMEEMVSRSDQPSVKEPLVVFETKTSNVDGLALSDNDAVKEMGVRALPRSPLLVQLMITFSVWRSWIRLLHRSENEGKMMCLHGIRVLSTLWVTFANTVVFSALNFENLLHAAQDLISFSAQVILNSSLAQDTFFVISGVLTALSFFKMVHGTGGVKVQHFVYYYLHRFVRISPAYILLVLVCVGIMNHTASGPHWPPPIQMQCREQWWKNLLFINNYFVSIENMCMSWTWFLAVLMQFYWLAPVILIPFVYGKKVVGFLLVGICVVLHISLTSWLEFGINGDILRHQSEYLFSIYQQPYCRIAPFALGLALGFVLEQIHFKYSLKKVILVIGWGFALCGSFILSFVTYDENRFLLENASGWSLPARTLHEVVQRPLWAAIVCWVIFASITGNAGYINQFLSWRGFLPLARLSYGVYLIHPLVVIYDLYSYGVFAYFTISYVVFRYIGYVVVSYLLALLLTIIIQVPFLGLEEIILR